MRNNKGFSLVELIVVIAIMAILAAVAVAGFSFYIPKAQKASDEKLFSDVEYALKLGYQAGYDVTDGYVVLYYGENATATGEGVAQAMAAAFGENWQTDEKLQLKTNWMTSFEGSSFDGKEQDLLNKIDNLTGTFGETILELGGENFNNYMNGLGVDSSQPGVAADAAVFYVANQVSQMDKTKKQQLVTDLANVQWSSSADAILFFTSRDMSNVSAAASLYTLAEGMCTYLGDADVTAAFNNSINNLGKDESGEYVGFEDQGAAVAGVFEAFNAAQSKAIEKNKADNMAAYFTSGSAGRDMQAYFDMLTSVASADTQVKDSFGQDDCFSNLGGLVDAVANGGVVMYLEVVDGQLIVVSTAQAE